jgi:aryl-alcohol dehydrogenase-like predicted oxidoreductase
MTTLAPEKSIASVADYTLLGSSGLRVSPLCLGTMTFGTEWGWGAPIETARAIFDRYLEAGGNFVDTADLYTAGKSEEFLGEFLKARRDRVVLATKYTFNAQPGDPNAGGNQRKNFRRAVEGSLQRLRTDYIDLYWLHCWDGLTPVDEVMATVDALVREGKILHFALSDTPAWYAARAWTLAEMRGWERPCAMQLEYSLVERNIEREHIPLALESRMAVLPWSPLASGFLTGKYKRTASDIEGQGRLQQMKNNPIFDKFAPENWRVLDELLLVAKELGRSPAQVALNWVTKRPGVASTIIGATSLAQLDDNLKALEFDIPKELAKRLEAAGRPKTVFPYTFFEPARRGGVSGGTTVRAEPKWWRG